MVLSLLAVFTLVAISYVLVASSARTGAVAIARSEQQGDPPHTLLDLAAGQVIVGSNNPLSVIGPHGLVPDDMYGPGIMGRVEGVATWVAGGQMVQFDVVFDEPPTGIQGYYVGRVFTLTTGPAAYRSQRVTGYIPNPGTQQARLRVMSPGGALPGDGDRFLINGREFSGTGFGYHPNTFFSTGLLDFPGDAGPDGGPGVAGTDDDNNGFVDDLIELGFPGTDDELSPGVTIPIALLPNPTTPEYRLYLTQGFPNPATSSLDDIVFANEDYDVADFQNMILAAARPTLGPDGQPGVAGFDDNQNGTPDDVGEIGWSGSDDGYQVPIPSLHRPALINYWLKRTDEVEFDWLRSVLNFPRRMRVTAYLRATALTRKFVLRPLPFNHFQDQNGNGQLDPGERHFTGSNPFWDMNSALYDPSVLINGPWDVDNDGDGTADSVWADLGLPVQTGADGKLYKPLFAILCLDMDGRLNLNAHGGPQHIALIGGNPRMRRTPWRVRGPFAFDEMAGTPWEAMLPFGQGMGTAEINLNVLFPNSLEAANLMWGTDGTGTLYRPFVTGRYGENHLRVGGDLPMPGATAYTLGPDGRWGVAGVDDDGNGITDDAAERGWPLSDDGLAQGMLDKFRGDDNMPMTPSWDAPFDITDAWEGDRYFYGGMNPTTGAPLGPYGTPADLGGIGPVGLDARGQPITVGAAQLGGVFDDPYELDLSLDARRGLNLAGTGVAERDAPFAPDELERLLRYFDADSSTLPDRLLQLAPIATSNNVIRGMMTSESWDTPTPAVAVPRDAELRKALFDMGVHPGNITLVDLLKARIAHELMAPPGSGLDGRVSLFLSTKRRPGGGFGDLVHELLAPELISGLRMDLNRPFGNNFDDNNNGVVDEAEEAGGEELWRSGIIADNNADGVHDILDQQARQRFAKHLFVLMLLLTPEEHLMRDDGNDDLPGPDATEPLTSAQKKELRIRRIAQWAVNVVDFRDRDAIMTPFEYDVNPYNGWDVDGDLRTEENDPDRRVVWGAEYPDLLITETTAGHDRRVRDLPVGGKRTQDMKVMGEPDDDDFDQERMPEGWAFVELYCTRNPNNPNYSADLYTPDGRLDLGRMSPATTSGDSYPVWRLAVSNSHPPINRETADNVLYRASQKPRTFSFQPDRPSLLPNTMLTDPVDRDPIEIDRIVWFAGVAPTGDLRQITYYNRNWQTPEVPLAPGQYAVVGPSRMAVEVGGTQTDSTKIGAPFRSMPSNDPRQDSNDPPQVFSLSVIRNGVPTFDFTDNTAAANDIPPYPTADIKTPLGIAVAADVDATMRDGRAGFSISEPRPPDGYYPQPDTTFQDPDDNTYVRIDEYTAPLDTPLDSRNRRMPLMRDELLKTRTTVNYKTAMLQRLANPLLPWNPRPTLSDGKPNPSHDANAPVNPYLTVDWMPMDLSVYNGEARPPGRDDADKLNGSDPEDPADPMARDQVLFFASRQRGDRQQRRGMGPTTDGDHNNLWAQQSAPPGPIKSPPYPFSNPSAMSDHNFRHLMDHTLGYLNLPFQDLRDPTNQSPYYLNGSNPYSGIPDPWDTNKSKYAGDPVAPFPWLHWPNRPLVSQMELLEVPAAGPARMLFEFTLEQAQDPYRPDESLGAGEKSQGSFGHLLNFFQSAVALPPDPMNPTLPAGNYHQLLEYVHVPSRFSGTEMLLRPEVFSTANTADAAGSLYPYYAPFNYFSRYRDPGRVNVNTIYDNLPFAGGSFAGRSLTFRGLVDVSPPPGSDDIDVLWDKLWRSRQGYGAGSGAADMFAFNPDLPTFFANPFRSPASAYNVPIEALRQRTPGDPASTRRLAEAGLLRPDPDDLTQPLLGFNSAEEVNDTRRNPYFRYQAINKLGNLVTTRSNVYAIWITVGYFEVHRVPVGPLNPDGYALGEELGYDTGEIERHRAFYLYDRTIPVAAQRGEKHNIDEGFLIKRFIE